MYKALDIAKYFITLANPKPRNYSMKFIKCKEELEYLYKDI